MMPIRGALTPANDHGVLLARPEGAVMMREVDAPTRLFGRQWGGFRTAYRL
jgi:hypothetical protein